MKSGRQQDMLERNTNPLPDHIRDKFRKEDEIDKELEASIQDLELRRCEMDLCFSLSWSYVAVEQINAGTNTSLGPT